MQKVNVTLKEGNHEFMFVTAWIGIINLKNGRMCCTNAGHLCPMIRANGEDFKLYRDPHATALGVFPKKQFNEYELQLQPGDSLFVYTDGIPEAMNPKEEQYGLDRLREALNREKDASMEALAGCVANDVKGFQGDADQFDDITMLAFRYLGE